MGGTLGTAVFLSILFTTLPDKIGDGRSSARPPASPAAPQSPLQLQTLAA